MRCRQILELTLLIADYMNALGRMQPGGPPQMGTLTRVGSVHGSRPDRLRARMPSVGSEASAELLRWAGEGEQGAAAGEGARDGTSCSGGDGQGGVIW